MLICICHVKSNKLLLTNLLTYLPIYLFNFSQHYDGDVDIICNLHIFVSTAIDLQEDARLLQHLFYCILLQTHVQ